MSRIRKPTEARPRRTLFLWLLVAAAVLGGVVVLKLRNPRPAFVVFEPRKPASLTEKTDATVFASYSKSPNCKSCHEQEYQLWQTSHHALAERPIDSSLDLAAFQSQPKIVHASQTSEVLVAEGKFQLVTAAQDGQREGFFPERVIGVDPLRQFMIPAAGGRFQVTEIAFDPRRTNWFDVFGDEDRHPGEWGHWTGRGMTWNSMCAACHNTRLRKHYQEKDDTYATSMAEMSVGCESCHGPMGEHGERMRSQESGVRSQKLSKQYSVSSIQSGTQGMETGVRSQKATGSDPTSHRFGREEVFHTCGSCHSRRGELTGEFVPGENYFDHYAFSIPDETDLFYADGQIRDEDYEFTAFLGSKMHAAGVRCIDCHEPHSGKTRLGGNALCMMCHGQGGQPNAGAATQAGAPKIDPLTHSHHKIGGRGDRCVDCHMPQTNYMQRHGRHDHGFTIPDPWLTKQTGIPNACGRCHGGRIGDAVESVPTALDGQIAAVEKWYGKRMERPARARAQTMVRAKAGDLKAVPELTHLLRSETNAFWRAVSAGLLRRWAGESNVTAALIASVADRDPLVRAMSVRSLEPLAQYEIPSVQAALQTRLSDPVRAVRIDAAWAIHAILDTNSMAGDDLLTYLRQNADQPSGQMQLGVFSMDRGNLGEAVEHLRHAVEWDTNSVPPRHALAVAFSLQGKPDEAVTQLQAACRLAPRDAEMQFKLGLALNEAGKPDAARAALEQAVKLDAQFSQAWYNLGLAYNAAGQTDKALEALVRAESLDSNSSAIPYARATILARTGRNEEARIAARRALEIRPDYADAAGLLQELSK